MVLDNSGCSVCCGDDAVVGCCHPNKMICNDVPFPQTEWYEPCLHDCSWVLWGSTPHCPCCLQNQSSLQGKPMLHMRTSLARLGIQRSRAGTCSQVLQWRLTQCKSRTGPMDLVVENNSVLGRNQPLKVREKGIATLQTEGFGAKCHFEKKTFIHHLDSLLAEYTSMDWWMPGSEICSGAASQWLRWRSYLPYHRPLDLPLLSI